MTCELCSVIFTHWQTGLAWRTAGKMARPTNGRATSHWRPYETRTEETRRAGDPVRHRDPVRDDDCDGVAVMRVALEVTRWDNPCVRGPDAMWRDSEPFVENRRGILIHRPRSVNMYNNLRKPHIVVSFYCGNQTTDSVGNVSFLSAPPEDAILCQACEFRAVMAGLPTASSLAGRHVHVGKLKAVMTCCAEKSP